jgi:hypothetical protein
MGGGGRGGLTDMFTKMGSQALASNVAREKEVRGIFSNIMSSLTGSNNSLRASGLADIETRSKQLIGGELQNLISGGMFGTTTAASVPSRIETEFARPARLKLEDLVSTRLRETQLGLAGFIEGIQNPYPDYNVLLQSEIAKSSRASTPSNFKYA